MIGAHDRGVCVNWSHLISEISKFGEIVSFEIFLPYYCFPGYVSELEKIITCIRHAKPVATLEGVFDKDVTDSHIARVAISLLSDKKASPDTLVIGSGDHYFAPIAELFEKNKKKVVFFSCESSAMHHMLEKSINGEKRDTFFIMEEDHNFTYKFKSFKIFEDELRMLTAMLLNENQTSKISPDNRLFRLVKYAHDFIDKNGRRFDKFNDLIDELKISHKREINIRWTYHENDWQYKAVAEMLSGNYIEGDYLPALVRVDDDGLVWHEIDRQSHLSKAIVGIS